MRCSCGWRSAEAAGREEPRTARHRFRRGPCPRPCGALPCGATPLRTLDSSSEWVSACQGHPSHSQMAWPPSPQPLALLFVSVDGDPMGSRTSLERRCARHHRRGQRACASAAVMRSAFHCWIARTRPGYCCEATAWRRRCRSLCPSAFGVPWHPKDRRHRDRPGSRTQWFALFWNVYRPRLVLEGGATRWPRTL